MTVVTWQPGSTPLGRGVAALGVFDGVHLGHQGLIASASREAISRGLPCVAVTFDQDPDQVLTPRSSARELLTLADKCGLLVDAGVDAVLVLPFDPATAALTPRAFVSDVLLAALMPHSIHVGRDFRFGCGATGDVETLTSLGDVHGFDVVAHDLVCVGGHPVTSTRIRALIAAGDVSKAAALLGRDHCVTGRVVSGRGVGGRVLGVPTANVNAVPGAAVPADGVYAGWVEISRGPALPAAISVGRPPSFPEAIDGLEVHVLDYEGSLYGAEVKVGFSRRIRDLAHFDATESLAAAIRADIAAVRRGLQA